MTDVSSRTLPGEAARVKTLACLGGISLERGASLEEIRGYVAEPSNTVWVDIQDPGPEEFSFLLEEFGFHPLALEDAAQGQQRAKVDEYKGYLFVVTYAAVHGAAPYDCAVAEVDLFVGRNYLVTIHCGAVPALDTAMVRWARGGAMLREGVGFLVYTVMDAVIDGYFPVLDGVEEALEAAELQMFSGSGMVSVERLLKFKRTLSTLRRVLGPLREIFHLFLRRDNPLFSANTLVYFQDVNDHVLRLLDTLDVEREMLGGVLEAQLAVVSNRLNATMKTLTVITVVVAIAGSVFGAWGMNFQEIPLSQTPWGFWTVWGGTVGLIVLALLFSWKRGWL